VSLNTRTLLSAREIGRGVAPHDGSRPFLFPMDQNMECVAEGSRMFVDGISKSISKSLKK